ncbi:hypothetical protein IVB26_07170 [Bradyrhizobium sp. 195]|nr:hypothetical protein IVB26_07170 [Bradyrhizobium sp. 195]
MAQELDRLIIERGKPKMVVSDNGSELTSNAILAWTDQSRVGWHYIALGKPMQTPRASSIDGPSGASDFDSILEIGRVHPCIRLVLRPISWPRALTVIAVRPSGSLDPSSAGFHRAVICPQPKVAYLLCSLPRSLRPVELTGHHHRQNDPSKLVGNGDCNDRGATSLK